MKNKPNLWPKVAVVGIAGPVDRNTCEVTNCPHWPIVDGAAIGQNLNIPQFTFINDFAAAG